MNSNVLEYEDITENIIVFKLTESYKENMTKRQLYDITRGCWPVDIKRAQCADYAFCVHENIIKEVYKIEKWLPAEKLQRENFPYKEDEKGRYGFEGEIAEPEVRNKYRKKSVENICKPGRYSFKYLPPDNYEVITEIQKIEKEIAPLNIDDESKKAIINVRVNQGKFRDSLLKRYHNKCCLCGVKIPKILIASHIKPWAESKTEEKADVDNGFLMCPNHDKLFDKGYITFEDDGTIRISKGLTENEMTFLNVNSKMHIEPTLTKGNKKYLKFHRKDIFNKYNENSSL